MFATVNTSLIWVCKLQNGRRTLRMWLTAVLDARCIERHHTLCFKTFSVRSRALVSVLMYYKMIAFDHLISSTVFGRSIFCFSCFGSLQNTLRQYLWREREKKINDCRFKTAISICNINIIYIVYLCICICALGFGMDSSHCCCCRFKWPMCGDTRTPH